MEKIAEYTTVKPKRTQYNLTSNELRDLIGLDATVTIESIQFAGENNEIVHLFTRG